MFKEYVKKETAEIRPYVKGEDLSNITKGMTLNHDEDMGMIVRDKNNHDDQWYVSRNYFEQNYELRGVVEKDVHQVNEEIISSRD